MPFHNGDVKIEPGETKIVGLGSKAELREIVKDPFYTDVKVIGGPQPYFLYPRSSIAKRGLSWQTQWELLTVGIEENLRLPYIILQINQL